MYQIEIKAFETLTDTELKYVEQIGEQVAELDRVVNGQEIKQKLEGKHALVLVAFVEGEPAGFKIGYALSCNDFYSWLGGVASDFRQLGVAQGLLDAQERWVQQQGYETLKVKTQNQFKNMLSMLVKNDYQITDIEQLTASKSQSKLILEKHFDSLV